MAVDVPWCLTDPENPAGRVGYYFVVGLSGSCAHGSHRYLSQETLLARFPARRTPGRAARRGCPAPRGCSCYRDARVPGMGAGPRRLVSISAGLAPGCTPESRPDRGQGRRGGCVSGPRGALGPRGHGGPRSLARRGAPEACSLRAGDGRGFQGVVPRGNRARRGAPEACSLRAGDGRGRGLRGLSPGKAEQGVVPQGQHWLDPRRSTIAPPGPGRCRAAPPRRAAPRSLSLQSQRPEQGSAFGAAGRSGVQLVQTPARLIEQFGGLVEQR